jgi:hypothetical protein
MAMTSRAKHSVQTDRLRAAASAVLGALFCLGLAGCDESRACERQRLDLFQAWQEVNRAIEERKLNSTEAHWTTIQPKIDVLQSAFATPQVTWDSATKNREEAATLVGGVSDSGQGVEIFRATFNAAGAKQAAYYDACR